MDILRPFRSCFHCGRRDNLIQKVVHMAYSGMLWYYYHEECLKEVLCNPREHKEHVDLALDIVDCIEAEEAREERLIEKAERACKRVCSGQ